MLRASLQPPRQSPLRLLLLVMDARVVLTRGGANDEALMEGNTPIKGVK